MKPLRESFVILALAVIPALLSLWLHPQRPVLAWTKPGVEEVELATATGWSPPVLWVDARAGEAFQHGHVPDAIPLNEASWEQQLPGFLAAWRPGTRIVVYCDSRACDASQGVALRFERELKLPEIYVLKGGWASWQQTHR